jgi:hypothetical protein
MPLLFETTRQVAIDTGKAVLPVGGGIALSTLKFYDELLTVGIHLVGFLAALIGLAWYVYRICKDIRAGRITTYESGNNRNDS